MRTGSSTCVLSCCDDFLLFGEADSGFDPGFDSVVFTPSIRRSPFVGLPFWESAASLDRRAMDTASCRMLFVFPPTRA